MIGLMTRRWGVVVAVAASVVLAGDGTTADGPGRAREAARLTVRALLDAGSRAIEAAAYAEAEIDLRDALALAEDELGPNDLDTARTLNELGMLAKYTARFEEGRADYVRALAIAEAPG